MFTKNPIGYLTSRMWKYSAGNRKAIVLYFCLFIVANIFNFLDPLIIAKMINILQTQGLTAQTFPTLMWYLAAVLGLTVGFWLFHGPARYIENKNAFMSRAAYKKYLIDGVMAFPLEWHTNHHSGDTIDKIEKGTQALYRFSSHTFELIAAFVLLISAYVTLTIFNVHAGYLVLGMMVITVIVVMLVDRVLLKQYKTLLKNENSISEKVFDVISNITTVIILRVEKVVSSSVYKKIMEPLKIFNKSNRINETKWFLVSFCSSFMTVLVVGSYLYMEYRAGAVIVIGTIYLLYEYVGRMTGLLFRFAWMYGDILQQKAAVLNAEEIANEFSRVKKPKAVSLGAKWNTLAVSGLNFSYHAPATETDGTKQPSISLHLDNVAMTINRGSRIALIGESGSGKTTFLKVIRDLYHPQRANITLDGKRLPNGFKAIRKEIALIPQDPEIFATTIGENITFGVSHDAKTIKHYTDMACFTDVVDRLPHKLDSAINERGVNLSGGEKQRLALSRGLMACEDKSIILLDEPTSSVDMKNELTIFKNIFTEFKGKTIIASVHRLHLLPLFDMVIMFREGKIIAQGTQDSLLKNSPEFQALWQKYLELNESVETH